jgi:hypothetical protein
MWKYTFQLGKLVHAHGKRPAQLTKSPLSPTGIEIRTTPAKVVVNNHTTTQRHYSTNNHNS